MLPRAVSPEQYRRICLVALVSLAAIVLTGAAVRLTGSGLGCSDWPTCERNELVPAGDFHAWVEFGNRLVTGIVSVAVIAAVLAARRRTPRRRDLEALAWVLVAGVVLQVLVGALTVRWHLVPGIVMAHFLISMVLVADAVALHMRASEDPYGDGSQPRLRAPTTDGPTRSLVVAVFTVATVVLTLGTVVTAAGPNAGDEDVDRLAVSIEEVTRIHSLAAWVLFGLTVTLVLRTLGDRGTPGIRTPARLLLVLLVVQGTVGYIQYAAGIPTTLVAVHVALATTAMILVTRLVLATSEAVASPEQTFAATATPEVQGTNAT